MPVTDVDITNRALAEIGTRSKITSMTDGSPEATYANILYEPLRNYLLTTGDWDFSTLTADAVLAGPLANSPWLFSYNYPSDAAKIKQLVPTDFDIFDPHPVAFNIHFDAARFIYTKEVILKIIYIAAVDQNAWPPDFTEAFVRLLGSALTLSLGQRIEVSKQKLSEALQFAGIADLSNG